MRWWRKRKQVADPDPPVNIRVHYDDLVVPVDAVYVGFDGEEHEWEVINPRPGVIPAGLSIEVLPAHTCVTMNGRISNGPFRA